MKLIRYGIIAVLIGLICTGIVFRFQDMDWNQGASLHPDEYGLTNTLTQLHTPANLGDYFNTRLSPLSPYAKYDLAGQKTGDGPDNRLRWGQWPIIMIRGLGELTGNTGYDEIRMLGRYFSAFADTLSVMLILLIGWQLYGLMAGLLGAALSSLAVMQIQQSHFMTVDNFSAFFAVLAMTCAVQVARQPCLVRPAPAGEETSRYIPYRINGRAVKWFIFFGISFGMALASKINLLPLGGMILIAVFISAADLKLRYRNDLTRIGLLAGGLVLLSVLVGLLTFRVTQPMSFRAAQGDTTLLTLRFNPDWTDSMDVAQQESNGIGGGPPSEQWANRPPVVFPLMNMVVWGMGIPLGAAAWAGFLLAAWQVARHGKNWRAHLLPLVWTGGYFLVMGTRFVSSVRYFLPIYPFLCLLAGWLVVEAVRTAWPAQSEPARFTVGRTFKAAGAALLAVCVAGGTLTWATAFTQTVFGQDHTRIQATKWIYQNIPAPFQIGLKTTEDTPFIPIAASDGLKIGSTFAAHQEFSPLSDGTLATITLPHVLYSGTGTAQLKLTVSADPEGTQVIDEAMLSVPAAAPGSRGVEVQGVFKGAVVFKGTSYYLNAAPGAGAAEFTVYRNVVANEDWDEGLPVRFFGYDPFGQFYTGITMSVRWADDENKRQMYYKNLQDVDYVILPSQRSIWSVSRFPLMYPMTIEYYRALFDGRLGFDLAANFQAPEKIGPLWISDVGGLVAWNQRPTLPRFNFNFLAAEEAFSVYDHPPVWIFKKRPDFQIAAVVNALGPFDLSKVVVQSARNATTYPIQ